MKAEEIKKVVLGESGECLGGGVEGGGEGVGLEEAEKKRRASDRCIMG